jgi:thymidine phosphorylase
MVVGQGGPVRLVDEPAAHFSPASVVKPVFPEREGHVAGMDMRAVGTLVVGLGGGRRRAEDDIDPRVGLTAIRPVGAAVGADRPLAVVHAADEDHWQAAAAALRSAVCIGPEAPAETPVVHAKIEGVLE